MDVSGGPGSSSVAVGQPGDGSGEAPARSSTAGGGERLGGELAEHGDGKVVLEE